MVLQPSVPVHYPSLQVGDFLTYLSSPLRRGDAETLQSVWEPVLGPCRVLPLPTGRHALWIFLELGNYQPRDEVLISSYNFFVMVRLIIQKGLVPVFVDVDPDTLCMDPTDLESKLTSKSRLVIATHMYGAPADMKRISALCKKHDLDLFEDCAHAVGTQCEGKQVGQFGDGALFSFGIYKMINAFGGGMLVLRDEFSSKVPATGDGRGVTPGVRSFLDNFVRCALSAMLHPLPFTCALQPATRMLPRMADLLYPSKDDPDYVFRPEERGSFKGYMTKMIERQLDRLDANIERRRVIASFIKAGVAAFPQVKAYHEDKHGLWNAGYFGLGVPDSYELASGLRARGIETNRHEYYNCASLDQFAEHAADCPKAEWAEKHFLRIPNYPTLSERRVEEMGRIIQRCLAR